MQKHHRSDGKVTKEEFEAMSREVVKAGSFRVGKASVELGMLLFGAPACALLAKLRMGQVVAARPPDRRGARCTT